MYIVKNALRCISRSKGRNILIGIIALVILVSHSPDVAKACDERYELLRIGTKTKQQEA